MNNFLSLQNNCMERYAQANGFSHLVGRDLYTGGVNTIQIVVERLGRSSGYGKHSDNGKLLNSGGSLTVAACSNKLTGQRLPFREEMQTVTVVLTTCKDRSKATHRLKFTKGITSVGTLETTGNCMHVQMHGTQMLQHQVISIGTTYDNHSDLRIVLSFRRTKPTTARQLMCEYHNAIRPGNILTRSCYQTTDVFRQTTWYGERQHELTPHSTPLSPDPQERTRERNSRAGDLP